MFHFLFRMIGLFFLAFALILAVLDITRSITASSVVLTPLAKTWGAVSPRTFLASKQAVVEWTHPIVWDPFLVNLLLLPSWLAFWLVAMILLWLGQKTATPYGRFASR